MNARRWPLILAALFTAAVPVHADQLEVTRTATLRAEPDGRATVVSKQERGTTLSLAAGELRNGYYAVTDPGTRRAAWVYKTFVRRHAGDAVVTATAAPPQPPPVDCSGRLPMKVHFYDVGQALAVLVDLPDGRRILVDAGESATRCGAICKDRHEHLLQRLAEDLKDAHISMMWITHQHSDHLGGAVDVLNRFPVDLYVDNGEALDHAQVRSAREAAARRNTRLAVVGVSSTQVPLAQAGENLRFRPVVPSAWPDLCEDSPNECSIGLRIDYCSSSVLFTGDAGELEEGDLEPGRATLLQVGHHGSDTSSSSSFISRVNPKYAVISAGRKGEGLNKTYCHPRKVTVTALNSALGGAVSAKRNLPSYSGTGKCRTATSRDWTLVRPSQRLWSTSLDGDVTLVTSGDGVFVREEPASAIANR